MQFDRLSRKLEGISDASIKGRKVTDLFKIMTNQPEIWFEAIANLYPNKGAITKGVNNNTLDGYSLERVENIMTKLKEGKYKFTPARRVYIPKPKSNKKRPLGIMTGDDKLIQEVIRILLEKVYEPIFSENSHGFRPNRSCHTALERIQKEWTGIKWFIEFDIKGFFDNLAHSILVKLLEKKIDDRRFIKLIKRLLKAGYLEEWRYHPNYSGTPQGGICSPTLSNVFLHELDMFFNQLQREFSTGKKRRLNPEYDSLAHQKTRLRKEIDKVGKRKDLIEKLNQIDRTMKTLPSGDPYDEGYRRLRYCRYADDFIAGIIGTKDEAREIMDKVKIFIGKELQLEVAEQKTGIKSGKEGIQFLSYKISVYRTDKEIRTKIFNRYVKRRSVADCIRLQVPEGKALSFCQKYGYGDWQRMKPAHRPELADASDAEIICMYNAELRGLTNYYGLASDVKTKLKKLEYLANYSLFHTLANKHKVRRSTIIARMKRGNEYIHKYAVKGEVQEVKVFRLKHMDRKPKSWNVDEIPNTLYLTATKSELVKRLNSNECEYCGRIDLPLESHHVKKLKDLKAKNHLVLWQKVMIARNRKTLILCEECHDDLHKGVLPDKRYHKKS